MFQRAVVLWISLTLLSCAADPKKEPQENSVNEEVVIPAVEAVKARFGSLPLSERISGTVEAKNQVALYPEISAPIEEIYVQNGEEVQQGEPLVKLQDDQYREQFQQAKAGYSISKARLRQAQARLKPLESQLERMQTLRKEELTSERSFEVIQSEVEAAKADVALAKAQVDQAQAIMQEQQNLLSKTTIRAPISGTVGQRNAEIGMQANPNTRLFVIGNLDKLTVEVVLTADMLSYVELGQKARIYLDKGTENQQVIVGEIARISPFLNEVTRSTEAEIEINNQKRLLKPGMFVPVDILYGESRQATILPTSAIYTDPQTGQEGVYVAHSMDTEIAPADTLSTPNNLSPLAEPTPVEFKPVEVLARGAMEVAVTNIKPGQWVVTVGQHLLSEGRNKARVRTVSWDKILMLQSLQSQDLLRKVLDGQTSNQ